MTSRYDRENQTRDRKEKEAVRHKTLLRLFHAHIYIVFLHPCYGNALDGVMAGDAKSVLRNAGRGAGYNIILQVRLFSRAFTS